MATQETEVKKPSTLGLMARGAAGLAITGAIVGALGGAAFLGGFGAFAHEAVGTAINAVGLGALVPEIVGPGSAALAGLSIGSIGGAILGAPAGAIAGPMHYKQMQTEAMVGHVAQESLKRGFEMGEEHGKQVAGHVEQESTRWRDTIAAQQAQAKSSHLGRNA